VESHLNTDSSCGEFDIYIGVPFCRIRCKSCPYFITLLSDNDPRHIEDRYVAALVTDIKRWANYPKFRDAVLRCVFIGGGTPSLLQTANIKRIIDAVTTSFKLGPDAEITLEGNPHDFDDAKIDYIVSSPINRLSLGVQSFQPEVLDVIGSPHSGAESRAVIEAFHQRGFSNVQADLIYNVPGHTMEQWEKDLAELGELGVAHFTIYTYRVHKGTLQERLINQGRVVPPLDPDSPPARAMHRKARQLAESMGYVCYMADHFCRPGHENQYNYWNWRAYVETLAFGPGSYSYLDNYRLGTATDVERYISTVKEGDFMISSVSDHISARVDRERYTIFAFEYFGIDFAEYKGRFGTDFLVDFADEVARLVRKGLVEITDASARLTPLGLEWNTNVCLEFVNSQYWQNRGNSTEPNWSLNGATADATDFPREHWLGDIQQDLFPERLS
jgi:oxygen-independent coproporphyrinogen-3 oxidase